MNTFWLYIITFFLIISFDNSKKSEQYIQYKQGFNWSKK